MIATSQDFTLAAVDAIRKPKARVTITWSDSTIDTSIVVSANDENANSATDQVADGIDGTTRRYFHWDEQTTWGNAGYWAPPATPEYLAFNQIGWWGAQRCGADGTWSSIGEPNPTIEVSFDVRPLRGIRVVGDPSWGEYPSQFNVFVYNGLTLLRTYIVAQNASVSWGTSVDDLPNVTSVKLVIIKWSHPERVVKITEFYTPVIHVYDGDDIIEMSIIEETDFENGTLPVGNISSNELSLKLQNADGLLFPDNANSDLDDLVRQNRKIFVELGFQLPDSSIEYVPMGLFWSGDWDTPEHEIYASTTARDVFDRLRLTEYKGDIVRENQSLYDVVLHILNDAKKLIPSLVFEIDTALQAIVIPVVYWEPISHAKALKVAVSAGLCYAYADRNGSIRVEQ